MKEAIFKINREYCVEIPIKVGDTIDYYRYGYEDMPSGTITYIFDGGNQMILDDKYQAHTNTIRFINGVDVRDIKGNLIPVGER